MQLNRIKSILRAALAELPELAISAVDRPGGHARAVFDISWAWSRTRHKLETIWSPRGWPSDVQRAIAEVPTPWPRNLVVVSDALSPGALEGLSRQDANWADAVGNVRLLVPPGLSVVKEAVEESRVKARTLSWSASSVAIAERILREPAVKITVPELAEQSGWSAPQVSNVLQAFDEAGWTTRHGPPRGYGVWRDLINPGSLLDAWSAYMIAHRPACRLGHRFLRDPMEFLRGQLRAIIHRDHGWAVTGWAGLELQAPFVSIVPSLQIYLSEDRFTEEADRVFHSADIRDVEDGANIEVWRADGKLLVDFVDDVPVATPARLYADLLAIGGRGQEGAQHLRETRIEF
jgi:hypothetical protein